MSKKKSTGQESPKRPSQRPADASPEPKSGFLKLLRRADKTQYEVRLLKFIKESRMRQQPFFL